MKVEVIEEGITLTESKKEVVFDLPGSKIEVQKENHTYFESDEYTTPIHINSGDHVVDVSVFAEGRLVGNKSGSGEFIVQAEPWFGYYDVVVTADEFLYLERIIATVVETSGMDILVNGEPFLIKGVNVHGLDGQSPEKSRSMMRIMRELGFNAWRGDYPPLWQMDLAYELNSIYTVLGPFSCTGTDEIFARQVGPPLATARELSRLMIDRYGENAGVLFWNSSNEIVGENIDFINSIHTVYKTHDPYKRPVHYANLYGQDLYQGQDVMGINYYFGAKQTAKDRQPLIQRSIDIARSHNMPVMFNEFNSYAGAVHSTGVEAMYGIYEWGIKQGMSGGFQYMKGNSTSHPGIFDGGFNTHKIYDEAIRDVLADAEISLKSESVQDGKISIEITNKRRFTLREIKLSLEVSGTELDPIKLDDLLPESISEISLNLPATIKTRACVLKGHLEFVSHFGFKSKIPVSLIVMK